MKSRLSRETANAIREAILEKVPQPEILRQYGIKKAMFSRIKSGKWFEEQAARDAKNHRKYPKGFDWCGRCAAVVKMPCRACKTRASANRKRSRHSREPELGFDLKGEHEEARLGARFGSI